VQWKELGGQGEPMQILQAVDQAQMLTDFKEELLRLQLQMDPVIQNAFIKVYDEFDSYVICLIFHNCRAS